MNSHACAPLISIVIPCYNAQAYLERCLQSILAQTELLPLVEIIAVNDASSDNTERILATYAEKHLLKYINLAHNSGPSTARNAGMAQAQGQYLWFIDSDDFLLPEAGAHVLRYIRNTPHQDLYAFGYTSSNSAQKTVHKTPFRLSAAQGQLRSTEALLFHLFASMRFFPWNKIMRSNICRAHPFPAGQWFEDISTIAAIASDCQHTAWSAKPVVHYFVNPHSTTGQMRPAACHDLFWCLKDFRAIYLQRSELQSPRLQFALASFLLKHCIDAICLLALQGTNQQTEALVLLRQLPQILLEDPVRTQRQRLLHLRYKNWRMDRAFVHRLQHPQAWTGSELLQLAKQRYKLSD